MNKKRKRLRRAARTRARIRSVGAYRLCVHRTPRHIYANIFSQQGDKVLCSVSSLDKSVRSDLANGGNIEAATHIGKLVAERAKSAGIETVSFDRSGFKYHGRIKALADAAREAGLKF